MPDKIYQHKQNYLKKKPFYQGIFFYVLTLAILVVLASLFSSGFQNYLPDAYTTIFLRIDPGYLLLYGLFTFLRLTAAYIIAVILVILTILIIVPYKKIENFLMPIFDILHSVPVLAFFPLIIVAFARLHAPEIAAQIVLVVAMAWAVLFGALGGIHQIPQDILDAAKIYGAHGISRYTKIIGPAIFPNLVTASILSWGTGWNVIIISEYINYGDIQIRLPGLGNLLSSYAGTDSGVFLVSLIWLIIIITLLNRLVWHRLLEYSQKYRFE